MQILKNFACGALRWRDIQEEPPLLSLALGPKQGGVLLKVAPQRYAILVWWPQLWIAGTTLNGRLCAGNTCHYACGTTAHIQGAFSLSKSGLIGRLVRPVIPRPEVCGMGWPTCTPKCSGMRWNVAPDPTYDCATLRRRLPGTSYSIFSIKLQVFPEIDAIPWAGGENRFSPPGFASRCRATLSMSSESWEPISNDSG